MNISEILIGASIRTQKSGVLLENIDRVDFDDWGKMRIRGYVRTHWTKEPTVERWTILDPSDINLNA